MDWSWLNDIPGAIKKPTPRKKLKARANREHADHVAEVRVYVFGRENGICRCCRIRRADSMHELKPRSIGGKVSKRNSVAVCGSGTTLCHGFLQQKAISWDGTPYGAEGPLIFRPRTLAAVDHMRVKGGSSVTSLPGSRLDELEIL